MSFLSNGDFKKVIDLISQESEEIDLGDNVIVPERIENLDTPIIDLCEPESIELIEEFIRNTCSEPTSFEIFPVSVPVPIELQHRDAIELQHQDAIELQHREATDVRAQVLPAEKLLIFEIC